MKPETSKPRSDAWDAALDEGQRWAAYDKFRRSAWHEVAKWIGEEYGINPPSRTSLYSWAARMRSLESAHRLEQAVLARAEAGELARGARQDDAELIEAYKTLAADLAMRHGDAEGAGKFTAMAMALADRRAKAVELEIKARAQQTKEAALDLMREKFEAAEKRLQAVREALAAPKSADGGLSPETLKKIEQAAGLL